MKLNLRQKGNQRSAGVPPTVLITGCSSGFGKHLVDAFLDNGWRVIATMRRAEERASLFKNASDRYGDRLIIANLDVTSDADRSAVTTLVSELDGSNGLNCLVNNAGYALFGALETCSDAQLREQFEVNLLAPTLLTKQLLPALRAARGSVINVSSIMSFMGFPLSSAYCSSKAGLTMLSEALSLELTPFGVRVHAVEPGGFRTGFVDNSQWGNVEVADYQAVTEGFHQFQDRLNQGPGNNPQPVINRIVELAMAQDSRLTHQVGRDAWMSKLMHKTVPESVRIKLMGMMFKRVLQ